MSQLEDALHGLIEGSDAATNAFDNLSAKNDVLTTRLRGSMATSSSVDEVTDLLRDSMQFETSALETGDNVKLLRDRFETTHNEHVSDNSSLAGLKESADKHAARAEGLQNAFQEQQELHKASAAQLEENLYTHRSLLADKSVSEADLYDSRAEINKTMASFCASHNKKTDTLKDLVKSSNAYANDLYAYKLKLQETAPKPQREEKDFFSGDDSVSSAERIVEAPTKPPAFTDYASTP